jgi:hypothetical protein
MHTNIAFICVLVSTGVYVTVSQQVGGVRASAGIGTRGEGGAGLEGGLQATVSAETMPR